MTEPFPTRTARRAAARPARRALTVRERIAVAAAGAVAVSLIIAAAAVPTPSENQASALAAYMEENAQTLTVPHDVPASVVVRDTYSATPGIQTLAAGGTNHDWAKLVLLLGGWPMSENNVTVLTRWMRQENGPDDWWNRNNPLNNGWGSGGGGGTGTYDNLVIAAENAAEALHTLAGYRPIIDALAASAPTEVTEAAIWASPWATGHYANGGHWSYKPVPVIQSPSGTW